MSPGIQGVAIPPAEGEWFELEVDGVVLRMKFASFPAFKGFEEARNFIEKSGYRLLKDAAIEPFRERFATPPDDFRKVFFGGSPRELEPELAWNAHGKVRIAFVEGVNHLGWYTGYGWDTWDFPEDCLWAVEAIH